MALVNITNIVIENNPALFLNPIQMSITFECLQDLKEEIEWKLIYIGSAKEEKYDQTLDQFTIGPLQKGVMQFTLESKPPDYTKIPSKEDLLGITAIILGVSYKSKEFFRVGYYVYNNYMSPENIENDPPELIINDIQRSILQDKPRITRFSIVWDDEKQIEEESVQNNQDFMFANNEQTELKDQMIQQKEPVSQENESQEQQKPNFQMNNVFAN